MADQQIDPRVDVYIEKAAPFAQPILAHLRELMHKACPRVTESVKWGMPFFIQQGVILCHMAAFKQHCAFGFWGPEMKKVLAKDGLNSSGAMGSLGRITALKNLPSDKLLLAYMSQAAELVETGERKKSIERPAKTKKKPVRVPAELTAALQKNKLAAKAFAACGGLMATMPRNRGLRSPWLRQWLQCESTNQSPPKPRMASNIATAMLTGH